MWLLICTSPAGMVQSVSLPALLYSEKTTYSRTSMGVGDPVFSIFTNPSLAQERVHCIVCAMTGSCETPAKRLSPMSPRTMSLSADCPFISAPPPRSEPPRDRQDPVRLDDQCRIRPKV